MKIGFLVLVILMPLSSQGFESFETAERRGSNDLVCSMQERLDNGLRDLNLVLSQDAAAEFDANEVFQKLKSFYFNLGTRTEEIDASNGSPQRCKRDISYWTHLVEGSCQAGRFEERVENGEGAEGVKTFNQKCQAHPEAFAVAMRTYLFGETIAGLKVDFINRVSVYFDAEVSSGQLRFSQPWVSFEINEPKWDLFWQTAWDQLAQEHREETGEDMSFVDQPLKQELFLKFSRPRGMIFETGDPQFMKFNCDGTTYVEESDLPNCSPN